MSDGVWAVVDIDYGESITTVHAEEIDALRAINERGYGRVKFVPWGLSLVDMAIDARNAKESTNV